MNKSAIRIFNASWAAIISIFLISASAQVVTYPAPPGISTSPDFTMTANGTAVWVVQSGQGGSGSLNVANFACTGQITIKVTASENIGSYIIRPKSRQISGQVSGRDLTFTIPGPCKLYLEINSLPHLAIFADAPEVNPPQQGDANVTYFAPGTYSGGITLQSNKTYYVAAGATVNGGITGSNVQNAKVIGRGFVIGNTRVSNSSNVEFNGINIQSSGGWTITWNSVNHSAIRNIKIFSYCTPWGCDGMDINHCQYVTIDDCFTRAMDDCIAIKSFPAGNQNTDSITVINSISVGWATSDGTTLGFELETDSVKNVLVKNCDFLYARGSGTSGGHSGFSITCDGPAWVTGIRLEDVRCEEHVETRNLELTITEGTQWGSSTAGQIGHIKGVYIKNCSWLNTNSPLKITGYGANNIVEDVTFDHCSVGGKTLTSTSDAKFEVNSYTRNIRFVNDPGEFTSIVINPATTAVSPGQTVQFTAQAVDQFGQAMPTQPASFTWSLSGGGTISQTGLFTAGSSQGGPYAITATGTLGTATKNGTAQVLVTNQAPGLNYSYYEGSWTLLPDFSTLTPIKSGTVSNFDISVATAADNFGIKFTGFISIPADGQYTFYTQSDDGSRLYIDNQLVVNNDGSHAPREYSGVVTLTTGMHAIMVTFFDASQGQELSVSWAGPSFVKQYVPNAVLFTTSGATIGFRRAQSALRFAPAETWVEGRNLLVRINEPVRYSIRIMSLSGRLLKTYTGKGQQTCSYSTALKSKGTFLVKIDIGNSSISGLVVVE